MSTTVFSKTLPKELYAVSGNTTQAKEIEIEDEYQGKNVQDYKSDVQFQTPQHVKTSVEGALGRNGVVRADEIINGDEVRANKLLEGSLWEGGEARPDEGRSFLPFESFMTPTLIAATTAISVIVPLISMFMTYRQNRLVTKSVQDVDKNVADLKEVLSLLSEMPTKESLQESIQEEIETQLKPILEQYRKEFLKETNQITQTLLATSGDMNLFIGSLEKLKTRNEITQVDVEKALLTMKEIQAKQIIMQGKQQLETTEQVAGIQSSVQSLTDVNTALAQAMSLYTQENESRHEQVKSAIDELLEKSTNKNELKSMSDSIKTLHKKANLSNKQQQEIIDKIKSQTEASENGFQVIHELINDQIEKNEKMEANLLNVIEASKEQSEKMEANFAAVKEFVRATIEDKTKPVLEGVRDLAGSIQGKDNTKDEQYMQLRNNVFNFQKNRSEFDQNEVLDWLTGIGTDERKKSVLKRVFSPVNMYYYAAFHATSAEGRLPNQFFREMRNLSTSLPNVRMLRTLYNEYMTLLGTGDDAGIAASLELMEENAPLLDDPNNQFVAVMRANMEKAMEEALEKEKNPAAAAATIDVLESTKNARDQVIKTLEEKNELTRNELRDAAELVSADLKRVEQNVETLSEGLESASDDFSEGMREFTRVTKEEFQKYGNIMENLEKTLNQGNLDKAADLAEIARGYEEVESFIKKSSGGGEPDGADDAGDDGSESGDSTGASGGASTSGATATSSAAGLGSEGEVTVPPDRDVTSTAPTSSSSSSSSRKTGKRPTFTLKPLTLDPEDFIIEPIILESEESAIKACSRLPYTHFAPSIKKESFARKQMCNLDNIEMLNPYLTTKSTVDYGDIICLPDDCLIPRSL